MPMKLPSSSKIKKIKKNIYHTTFPKLFSEINYLQYAGILQFKVQVTGLARFMSAQGLIQDLEIYEYCI